MIQKILSLVNRLINHRNQWKYGNYVYLIDFTYSFKVVHVHLLVSEISKTLISTGFLLVHRSVNKDLICLFLVGMLTYIFFLRCMLRPATILHGNVQGAGV